MCIRKESAEIDARPRKQSTDSSQTPESQHIECLKAETSAMVGEEEGDRLKWCSRADIKHKPSGQIPADLHTIIQENLGTRAIQSRKFRYLNAIFFGSSIRR